MTDPVATAPGSVTEVYATKKRSTRSHNHRRLGLLVVIRRQRDRDGVEAFLR